jgi:hypothetical protein
MRILLLFFVSIQFAFSQGDPLFKIINCSEGVTLDGNEVAAGQVVYSNSLKLEIPKKGYANVMTIEGYAYGLEQNVRVSLVNETIKNNKGVRKAPIHPVYAHPEIFRILGDGSSVIYEDSIFFAVFDLYGIGPPYSLVFKNVREEVVFQDTLDLNWKIFTVKNLFTENKTLLYRVTSIKPATDFNNPQDYAFIKRDERAIKKISQKLEKLEFHDIVELAAFYELYNLEYDHLFQLYKIETTKYLNLDPISIAYLAKQKEKYQLDKYNLKQ